MKGACAFILTLFAFIHIVNANVTVINGTASGESLTIFSTPLIFGGNSLHFTAIEDAPVSLIDNVVSGSAVYLPVSQVSTENLLTAADSGAVAIIYSKPSFFSNIGCSMYFNYDRSLRRITIPIVEVSDGDSEGILNDTVRVTITTTFNPCHGLYRSVPFIVVQSIVSFLCIIALILCFVRLFQYYRQGQLFVLSLGIVAIIIEIIANTLRLIYIINFLGSNLLYSPKFDDFMLYVSFPFSTITNVMIVMFWHEALVSKGIQLNVFLKSTKFKIAILVLSSILIGFEFLVATLRVATGRTPIEILRMPQVFGILVNFAALVYACVILTMVFLRAGGFSSEIKGNKLMKKILFRLAANSFLLVVLIISLIVLILPPEFDLEKALYAFGASYTSQTLLSILQVYSFQPNTLKRSTTGSNSVRNIRKESDTTTDTD